MSLIVNFTIAANAARLIRKQLRFGLGSRVAFELECSLLGIDAAAFAGFYCNHRLRQVE